MVHIIPQTTKSKKMKAPPLQQVVEKEEEEGETMEVEQVQVKSKKKKIAKKEGEHVKSLDWSEPPWPLTNFSCHLSGKTKKPPPPLPSPPSSESKSEEDTLPPKQTKKPVNTPGKLGKSSKSPRQGHSQNRFSQENSS